MHGGQDSSFAAWPGTPLQQQIISYLRSRVHLFIETDFVIEKVDWGEFFKVKSIFYAGEEVEVDVGPSGKTLGQHSRTGTLRVFQHWIWQKTACEIHCCIQQIKVFETWF